MRVPRHRWTPTTPEQRRAIAAAKRAAARLDKAEAELWNATQAARDLGVPARYLAREIKRGKTTVYRHVPAKPDDGEE